MMRNDYHLLSSLHKFFENIKNALIFGKERTITLDEVQTTVSSKEFQS